jgi:hypothetical protein
MKTIRNAQNELNTLKNDVIGIFKMRDVFLLVVNHQEPNNTIDIIRVTQFAVIQLEFNLPIHFGTLHLFPDNKNMNEMLENPFEWAEFIKQFN